MIYRQLHDIGFSIAVALKRRCIIKRTISVFSAKFLFIIKETPVSVKEKSINLVRVIHTSRMKLCNCKEYVFNSNGYLCPTVSLNLEISARWSLWQLL